MKRRFLLFIVTAAVLATLTNVADAGTRRKKPLPKKKPEYENPLDKKAYGRTQAFVDTDLDGQKFDFDQPPRERHAPTLNPNDRKKKKKKS